MVRYRVSSVSSNLKLERRCPHCGRPNGRIHSAIACRRTRAADGKLGLAGHG